MLSANLYRTPYGDITMRVVPASGSHTYKLRIKSIDGTSTLRDIVSSTVQSDGYVWLDYPVDVSCDDYGIAYPPSYVRYELYLDGVLDQGTDAVATLVTDNTVVKTRIGIIGQSNGEQHFSYLSSNYTNIGHASATTMRNAYATAKGVRPVTVQPINLAVGGSGSNEETAPSYAPHYYWWNLGSNQPGPCYAGFAGDEDENALPSIASRLSEATSVTKKLDALVISHGEQDASVEGSATDWMSAWEHVIAQIKVDAGNASLPVYWQALGRLYMNMAGTPCETNGAFTKAIRDKQLAHAVADVSVRIGAWPAAASDGVIYDGVHYTSDTYHSIATALGTAIATNTSLEASVPSWATYAAPSVSADKQPNGDIVYTFDGLTAGRPYKWRHDMVESPYYAIAVTSFTPAGSSYSFTWTKAAQNATYGVTYGAGYVNVRCWRHESDTNFGANGQYVGAA